MHESATKGRSVQRQAVRSFVRTSRLYLPAHNADRLRDALFNPTSQVSVEEITAQYLPIELKEGVHIFPQDDAMRQAQQADADAETQAAPEAPKASEASSWVPSWLAGSAEAATPTRAELEKKFGTF